ncbi:MAG: DUF2071 domain-containing protein [Verrucomicrobiia bacterium]
MKPWQTNPFPVRAWFERSCALAFTAPFDQIAKLLPPCLQPDTFDPRWGVLAVALVDTRQLRPAFLPKTFGRNFLLIGYRIFVRYLSPTGRAYRGLYILRSETDRLDMVWLGNLFTPYRYIQVPARLTEKSGRLTLQCQGPGPHLLADLNQPESIPLPAESPFPSWSVARRYCGPLPFTFSWNPNRRETVIIEGKKSSWTPQPVRVLDWHFPFLQSLGLRELKLANAFQVRQLEYRWKRGRTEAWKPFPPVHPSPASSPSSDLTGPSTSSAPDSSSSPS